MTVEDLIKRQERQSADSLGDDSSDSEAKVRTYRTQNVATVKLTEEKAAIILSAVSVLLSIIRLHDS